MTNNLEMAIDSLKQNIKSILKKDLDSYDYDVIEYSIPKKEKNKKIYEKVNNRLKEVIQNEEEGEYFHITGEMCAFSDPFHRKCIKELYEVRKYPINTIFYLPTNYEVLGHDILKYNKIHWENATWLDFLDAYDILGEGKAKLYISPDREMVQFSIFGNELILFQGEHAPGNHGKEVWVIESEDLFDIFKKYAKNIIKNSKFIQPFVFNHLKLSISNSIALHLLFSLFDEGPLKIKDIMGQIQEIDSYKELNLGNLLSIGFIQKTDGYLDITNDGKKYLEFFG